MRLMFTSLTVLSGYFQGILLLSLTNNRVIGGISSICSEKAKSLYSCFVESECICTNARTAEMVKLTENSCRDVQIALRMSSRYFVIGWT